MPVRSTPTEPTPAQLLRDEAGDVTPGEGSLRVGLVYPNAYGVGMSSLGFQMTRRIARDAGPARVERFFTSSEGGTRPLESNTPLSAFDVVLFSVSSELDFLNVLQVIEASGLPVAAARRDGHAPLIAAGGPAVRVNHHPLAPFLDVLFFGAAEALLPPFFERCAEQTAFRSQPAARRRLLEALAESRGAFVTPGALAAAGSSNAPEESEPAAAFRDPDEWEQGAAPADDVRLERPEPALQPAALEAGPFAPVSGVVTPRAEFGRRVLAEIARGCPNACAFCWLGRCGGPYAPAGAEALRERIEEACRAAACEEVGLIASAVGAHPEIEDLCEALLASGKRLSFSSLRAEEIKPFMLEALARSGQRSVTLAPETGGEVLRRRIGKRLTDQQILDGVDRAQRAGIEGLKLYYMIGLPEETDEDAERIVDLTHQVRRVMDAHGRPRGRLADLTVNLGVYVPKPGTPLARRPAPSLPIVKRRLAATARALGRLPNVRVQAGSPDLAAAQDLLSNGGLHAAQFLYEVFRSGGRWRDALRRRRRGA